MIKKLPQLAIMFFMAFTLLYCVDEEQVLSPDEDAASRLKPLAVAGKDVVISLPTHSTVLDGRKSTDTYGTIISYEWRKIAGPATFTIASPNTAVTKVTNLTKGAYTFRLTVTNDKNYVHVDDKVVTVTGPVYFAGTMDNVTIASGHNGFLGWDKLKNHAYVKYLHLNNIGGPSYAHQRIVKDPVSTTTNVMYATSIDDDPTVSGTTRAQTSIFFNDGVDLPVYHTSHRMYLDPDINYLKNYPEKIFWFTLFEIWNKRIAGMDGDVAGSARWNLSINKERGVGQPLYWRIDAQYMQPAAARLKYIWSYNNKAVPIPIGKWFTLDLYMKRGERANGRFIVKITPDGGSTRTLFSVANTTIYPGRPEVKLDAWQPFKLYSSDSMYDWMRNNGKKIAANYNDFRWYKD